MSTEYKFLAPPPNADKLSPREAREVFGRNGYYGPTSGFCRGYNQTNIAVLPSSFSNEFLEFCRQNSGPLPVLYSSKPGEVGAPPLANGSDIRMNVPRYCIFSRGQQVEDCLDLAGFAWDDFVTFYLGCSFSFESALTDAGIEVRNMVSGKNVSMYRTNVQCAPVGAFDCNMVVSMRPMPLDVVAKAVAVTAACPGAHGAPVHIGDPARLGVTNVSEPDFGDPTEIKEGEVPVFWACGVTAVEAIKSAKPRLAFTHYPGSMFITDVKLELLPPPTPNEYPSVVAISKPGSPVFASVLTQRACCTIERVEEAVLDDPGQRGVAHLVQKGDLLRASLALSHANSIAITTGFPCLFQYEQKQETDGLPGALAIAQSLLAIGKKVTFISDTSTKDIFQSCVTFMTANGSLTSAVEVLSYSEVKELYTQAKAPFDCLIAIERAGRAEDGRYRTMGGVDISEFCEPVDDLFVCAGSDPSMVTIGVGDGGNEVGMGKVRSLVQTHIKNGPTIACSVSADFLVCAGVSNWGGYGIAAGLSVVSSCPTHRRYVKHAVGMAQEPRPLLVDNFLPTNEQTSGLLQHMNSLGIRDGITHSLDQSVDGLPLSTHLQKLQQIRDIIAKQ